MLQYLLNATCIWLLSLAVFEGLLRRERYHSYNRLYLLCTFVLGLLVPLLQWPAASYNYAAPVLQQSIERAMNVKESMAVPTLPQPAAGIDLPASIYMAGVCIALCMLALDISRLVAFYRHKNKIKEGRWTIIETAKAHAPFSFLHTLFVSSRQNYDDNEWQMILRHEERHASLLHLADLTLMQLARIVFWFHPLVYAYQGRLSLVHEYQADEAAATEVKVYGSFLITQSMLAAAPQSAHSFSRSPIKNRILMLTRPSTKSSNTKMLLLLPLAAASLLCFSKNSMAQRSTRSGNGITTAGNIVVIAEEIKDTITLIDPIAGTESTHIEVKQTHASKINGREVQDMEPEENGLIPEVMTNSFDKYFIYLSEGLRPLLEQLEDGKYMIGPGKVLINEKGQLAYYELRSISWSPGAPSTSNSVTINKDLQESINKKTAELLAHCPVFGVYKNEGKAMPYGLPNFFITVKYHHLHAM